MTLTFIISRPGGNQERNVFLHIKRSGKEGARRQTPVVVLISIRVQSLPALQRISESV